MARSEIRTIDLFAGAGGLALGFELSGFGYKPIFAVENDPAAARTFKTNFDCEVHADSIELVDEYPKADVIIGGPPCQGFSPLGRDRDDASRAQLNELWLHYIKAVKQVRPKAFVIENVPEFQKSSQFERLKLEMATDPVLKEYGYNYGVLNAADYGVAQRRRRGILIAVRDVDEVPWPPEPTHGSESATGRAYTTLREVIDDLPREPSRAEITMSRDGAQDLHIKRNPTAMSLERYKVIPEGGNRFDLQKHRPDLLPPCWRKKKTGTTDVMGRLRWDEPGYTIRTEFYKPEKGRALHPEAHRPITHREAARIQSFPDEFYFEGSKIEVARQIGNAVPPGLAAAIARHVAKIAYPKRRTTKPRKS